jgi:hypothetical protein
MVERSAALKFSERRHLSHASKVYPLPTSIRSLGTRSYTLGVKIVIRSFAAFGGGFWVSTHPGLLDDPGGSGLHRLGRSATAAWVKILVGSAPTVKTREETLITHGQLASEIQFT